MNCPECVAGKMSTSNPAFTDLVVHTCDWCGYVWDERDEPQSLVHEGNMGSKCCATCKHWYVHDPNKKNTTGGSSLGGWTTNREGITPAPKKGTCSLASTSDGVSRKEGTKAYAVDYEQFSAALHTTHDFYCNQFAEVVEKQDA